jgi:hypothetical protein
VRQSLEQAEAALGRVVKRRRLSVSDRLALESEVTLAAGNLDAALPLAAFVHRAARGPLPEPTPVALVHRSRVEGPATVASLCLADHPDPGTLAVDLDAARMLLAVAVALVAGSEAPEAGRSTPGVSIAFNRCKALGPVTTICRGSMSGELVSVATLPTVEPTLACARAAAAGLGASFQLDPGGRARIAWPEGQRHERQRHERQRHEGQRHERQLHERQLHERQRDERTGRVAAASRLAPSSSRV